MSSSIGADGEERVWEKQTLIRYEVLVDILQQTLKIEPHPVPVNTYGSLVCVSGVAEAAAEIMDYLEMRAADKASEEIRNGLHHS